MFRAEPTVQEGSPFSKGKGENSLLLYDGSVARGTDSKIYFDSLARRACH